MVDINLIGDDQTRADEQDNSEKDFRSSFEPESNEPTSSSYMSGGPMDEADYGRYVNRGGSKKMVYLLGAFSVILLAAVVWFMLQSARGKKSPVQSPTVQPPAAEQTFPGETAVPPVIAPDATSSMPGVGISPALKDRILKSRQGIATVRNIINAIPPNVNFTILSYSDGAFFVECLAGDDAAINAASAQLQQLIAPAEVKLLSKENRTIQNRSFRQALVNGNVNVQQGADALASLSAPSYVTGSELQSQLANLAKQTGLSIKQFDLGREKTEGEFIVLPVIFRAQGTKDGILSFLQQINNANLNISFAKISVIPGANLSNTNITLLLNIGLYRVG